MKEQKKDLRLQLNEEQYRITQECGTEPPFANAYWDNHEAGIYLDVVSGALLFTSEDKFDSGTGWPSFTRPAVSDAVHEFLDNSHGMVRTEVKCAASGSHLGHVFDDGPHNPDGSGGLRYCINSAALRFIPEQKSTAYFAAGCFWGTEAFFRKLPGVVDVTVGYMGGTTSNPTYETVCGGGTGHAETVRIRFDPERIFYRELVYRFFQMHDPTSEDRQGPDIGIQYRSAVFCLDKAQLDTVLTVIAELEKMRQYADPIVTEVKTAGIFYPAEEYHQRYLEKHPGGYCHVNLALAERPLKR